MTFVSDLIEPERRTPVAMDVDICVVGGGAAGVAAAVSAAQCGARVALVERYGFLGGTLTTVSLGSICGLYSVKGREVTPVVGGFVDQVVRELDQLGGRGETVHWLKTASLPYDLFRMKVALDRLTAIDGLDVMLHSLVVDVAKDGELLTHVLVETREGRVAIRARQFIDCSGDADLCARSGAPFDLDLENLQQPTAMFRMMDVDAEAVARTDRAALHQHLERAVNDGLDLPRTAGGVFMERPGLVHLNITKVSIDGAAPHPLSSRELTKAERLGREQVLLYERAFNQYVPGYASARVLDTGAAIGVRESRRILGEYVLTGEDVLGLARFPDAIACCAWPMEDHAAGRATRWVWLEEGGHFQIPYRSLLPRGVDNLLVAGRCASADHAAQASIRVTAQCFAMGEAAGVAAATAVDQGCRPADVPAHELRHALQARGAIIETTP
jgi:hypothetical protein